MAEKSPRLFLREMQYMKIPVLDMDQCVECDVCIDICPTVFRRNDLGRIEVIELVECPEEEVAEVIKNCPGDCICWEET